MKHFFIPPYGFIFVWASRRRPIMRWFATGMTIFLVSIVWYYGLYIPLQRLVHRKYQFSIHDSTLVLSQLNNAIVNLQKELDSYGDISIKEEQKTVHERYQKYLLEILLCVQESEVVLSACTTGMLIIADDIAKVPLTYTIEGSLVQCAEMLKVVVERSIPVVCKRITCTLRTGEIYTIVLESELTIPASNK